MAGFNFIIKFKYIHFFIDNINYLRKYGKANQSLGRHNYEFLKQLSEEVKEVKGLIQSVLKEVKLLSAFPNNEVQDVSGMFPVHTLREIDLFLLDDGSFERRKNGLYNYLLLTEHSTQRKFRAAFIHALFYRDLIKRVRWPPNK